MPKSEVVIPDRIPDHQEDDYISPIQNLLYRLTGDTNLVHVDPGYAQKMGFDKAFMQGLCSFAFCCRMAIGALIPGQPERMKRMSAQMTSVLYPDTPVRFQLWKLEEGKACFRFLNLNTGKPVLDRGAFEWQ